MSEAASGPPTEPTAEQLLAEFKKLKVSDLVVSTLYTLSQVGYGKLDPEARDLEQARLAIESVRALIPVLEGVVADELVRDFNQMLASLQLAYASAATGTDTEPTESPSP
ncbi:MAG: peroxisomal biogenesis factor 3 [Actinomycetota bacterium]|nr:peroxisomal biogenesis factor 3 [Actinomycetota bacterium]